ncbi:glycosyl transferase [Cellulomonas terrae]|uniref:D-inositol 3-phosphate glycosyltransferase n=2 Tax=Cellulomonas terrae TaxID=311234 RepID=A0A511JPL7_9CELL|nr:glycosyl transferase [Cellulomonas terrae]
MAGGVLVHEWLARTGGSENVFDAMVEAFPSADLLCLWSDVADRYPGRTFRETAIGRSPLRGRKAAMLPVLPIAWRRQPGSYDWALVSSHLFAHHVSFRGSPASFEKYVYVHSPARYLWEPTMDTRGASPLVRGAALPLRMIDRARAREITRTASNSSFVRDRVRRAWGIDSEVIYPPVEVERIASVERWEDRLLPLEMSVLAGLPKDFVLGASRFVPYKALDLVIRAGEYSGLPVVLAGDGPDMPRLRAIAETANVPVYFVGRVSDEMLYALYQRTTVYVFPAIEDFGIMPVEAMAAGAPVVCGRLGGVTESVIDGLTGSHVDFQDCVSVRAGMRAAEGLRGATISQSAARFDRSEFTRRIRVFARVEPSPTNDGTHTAVAEQPSASRAVRRDDR